LEQRRVRPIVYRTFPLTDAAAAHRVMESSEHTGKIVLTMPDVVPFASMVVR
jgi:NADPH2:quinone reductase